MGKGKKKSHVSNKNDAIRMGRAIATLQKEYKRVKNEEIDRVEKELADLNVSCIFSLFTSYLATKFNMSPEKIMEALDYIDTEIGKLGGEYPTASELKIRCALQSGVAVLLNDEEKKALDQINDEKYQYILDTEGMELGIDKCIIEECGNPDSVICITFYADGNVKHSKLIPRDTKIYDTLDEAKKDLYFIADSLMNNNK